MNDTKSGDDKTLSVNTKKTLTLKRPGMEQGTVRQNFSHGRSKAVVVALRQIDVKDADGNVIDLSTFIGSDDDADSDVVLDED